MKLSCTVLCLVAGLIGLTSCTLLLDPGPLQQTADAGDDAGLDGGLDGGEDGGFDAGVDATIDGGQEQPLDGSLDAWGDGGTTPDAADGAGSPSPDATASDDGGME